LKKKPLVTAKRKEQKGNIKNSRGGHGGGISGDTKKKKRRSKFGFQKRK